MSEVWERPTMPSNVLGIPVSDFIWYNFKLWAQLSGLAVMQTMSETMLPVNELPSAYVVVTDVLSTTLKVPARNELVKGYFLPVQLLQLVVGPQNFELPVSQITSKRN